MSRDVRQNLATAQEVADYLGVNEQTLADWRYHGRGPAFVKVGRRVRYEWPAVRAWVTAGGEYRV